jgi:O-antigen ligase
VPADATTSDNSTVLAPSISTARTVAQGQTSVALLLAAMMAIVPSLGSTTEELLQDTLKSILVSFFSLTAAMVYFWRQRNQPSAIRLHQLLWLPLGLMAYAAGSMAWSHAYLGCVEAIRWFLFTIILTLGVNTFTRRRITQLAWGIHVGAVIAALWAALQFWIDLKLFAQGPNPASTFVNRNFFAEFLVCTLPYSVLLLTRVRDKTTVFLLTFSVGFNISALMMTGTRSALVGLLVLAWLLPFIVWWCRRQVRSTGWRAGHIIALVVLLISTLVGVGSIDSNNGKVIAESGRGDALDRALVRTVSIAESTEYTRGTFSIRAAMWNATWRMIRGNLVAGVGAGAWEVQAPLYQEPGSQLETDYYAHNEVLQLLAEYGLVGWLFLGCLLSYLVWAAHRTWSDPTPQGEREAPLRALTLSSLLVLLLVSNAGFPWRLASTGAIFAIGLGVLAASDFRLRATCRTLARTVPWPARNSRWTAYAIAICALCAAFAAYRAIECESKLIRAIKTALTISQSGDPSSPSWNNQKKQMIELMRDGIVINRHYRKLTPIIADSLAGWGDWKNATWIWESVAESRPNVVAILANIARGHLHGGDILEAQRYFDRAKALQPAAPTLASLEITLWSRTGRDQIAIPRAKELLRTGVIERELFQASYDLGVRNHDSELAILALEMGIKAWPDRAADGWLRLGDIYASRELNDQNKALQAYQAAVGAAHPAYRQAVWARIPLPYRTHIQ